MKTIVLATQNQGKIIEFQHALENQDIDLHLQSDYQIPEAEETGLTFVENALIKARHAAKLTGCPAIADDSGIVIQALKGQPGIYSARYSGKNGSSKQNIEKVLLEMRDISWENRDAFFYGVLVYLEHELDPVPKIAEGIWAGKILFEPQNEGGFGYDPIFYVPTHDCSAAQLSVAEKNRISHRGQALQKLRELFYVNSR